MPNKDYYKDLWISKDASNAEIKKAYKKLAMKYHPDRNKWSKSAEVEFKKINEAYQTLGDETKRKNYDQFGSADGAFGGFQGGSSQGFWGFEDIFSQFGGTRPGSHTKGSWADFEFGDLFSQFGGTQSHTSRTGSRQKKQTEHREESESIDVVETREIPFFDFILGTKIDIKTVYGKHLTITIKPNTKPGTKLKVAGKGRTINGKTGDLIVILEAKMPQEIPENVRAFLESMRGIIG